jgi:hypothetical protein
MNTKLESKQEIENQIKKLNDHLNKLRNTCQFNDGACNEEIINVETSIRSLEAASFFLAYCPSMHQHKDNSLESILKNFKRTDKLDKPN